MLMLALARDLPGGIDRCLNPPDGWGGPAGTELRGTTLGIIGDTGHSGALLKTICGSGFGMTVRGTSSKSSRAEFEAMLAESDFLSINCVLNDSTRNLLSDAEFALMKEGATLINCARAGIVDRSALEAALDSGRLRGAGIGARYSRWDRQGSRAIYIMPACGRRAIISADDLMKASDCRSTTAELPINY